MSEWSPGHLVALAVLGVIAAVAVYGLVRGFAAPPDPARMAKERAVVRFVDHQTDKARVAYADGLRELTMTLRELQSEGEHVLIERADGKAMSLWHPVTERRFRAQSWPVRWSAESFVGPVIMLVAAVVFGVFTIHDLRNPA